MTGTDLAGRAFGLYGMCEGAPSLCMCGNSSGSDCRTRETFGEIPGTKWLQGMEPYSCGEKIDNPDRMRSSDATRSGLLLGPVSG